MNWNISSTVPITYNYQLQNNNKNPGRINQQTRKPKYYLGKGSEQLQVIILTYFTKLIRNSEIWDYKRLNINENHLQVLTVYQCNNAWNE